MNVDLIKQMIAEKYVSMQKHPDADLFILNYTQKTQFEWNWNEATLMCRGLIVDGDWNIIARPFPKFFNLEELQREEHWQIPNEPFEVYEKLDGSLGILYWLDGEPFIATRGSFTSEQAIEGTKMFREREADWFLLRKYTYLFEIIYPQNRIVIDYGNERLLHLLAVIDPETGNDVDVVNPHTIPFPMAKRYDGIKDITKLRDLDGANREGFVVRFQSGLRIKLKYEEYKRLHRLITHMNPRHIWEHLREHGDVKQLIENVPDEFYTWVRDIEAGLRHDYDVVDCECKQDFKDYGNRKTNALYYQKCSFPSILFKMLDGKDYADLIWKQIKPKADAVFKAEI